MKMLKSLVVLSLFLISSAMVVAQVEKTSEEKAERMTKKMSQELNLDDKRTAELKVLNVKYVNEIKRIKSDETVEKEAKRIQVKEVRDSRKVDLKKLLSEKEYAQYETMEAEKATRRAEKKEMKQMSPAERAAKHTKKMTELLDLTPEQTEKVASLNERVEMKIEAIKNDESMSQEKKKEFIKGNRKDQMNAFKSILSQEQFEKYKEAKKGHHGDGSHEH